MQTRGWGRGWGRIWWVPGSITKNHNFRQVELADCLPSEYNNHNNRPGPLTLKLQPFGSR